MKKDILFLLTLLCAASMMAQEKITVIKSTRTVLPNGNTFEQVDLEYNEYGDEVCAITITDHSAYGKDYALAGPIATKTETIYDNNRNPIRRISYEQIKGEWVFNKRTENSDFDERHLPHTSTTFLYNPWTGEWMNNILVVRRYADADDSILESTEYRWISQENNWEKSTITTSEMDDTGLCISSTIQYIYEDENIYSADRTTYSYLTDPIRLKEAITEMILMDTTYSRNIHSYEYKLDEQGRIAYMSLFKRGVLKTTTYYTYEEILPSIPSSVRGFQSEPDDAPIYNIHGQRIQQPAKGLYIQGGRKIVK